MCLASLHFVTLFGIKVRISSPEMNTSVLVSCFQAGYFRRLEIFVQMSQIFQFTQSPKNIPGGFTGMKEELTARGMGTEMWTERLQGIMIQRRKYTTFYTEYVTVIFE